MAFAMGGDCRGGDGGVGDGGGGVSIALCFPFAFADKPGVGRTPVGCLSPASSSSNVSPPSSSCPSSSCAFLPPSPSLGPTPLSICLSVFIGLTSSVFGSTLIGLTSSSVVGSTLTTTDDSCPSLVIDWEPLDRVVSSHHRG